jgi:hypothetical protein
MGVGEQGAQGFEIGGMRDRALGSVAISLFGIFANARMMGGERKSWKNNNMR